MLRIRSPLFRHDRHRTRQIAGHDRLFAAVATSTTGSRPAGLDPNAYRVAMSKIDMSGIVRSWPSARLLFRWTHRLGDLGMSSTIDHVGGTAQCCVSLLGAAGPACEAASHLPSDREVCGAVSFDYLDAIVASVPHG
jgi:hypothetical protein